MKAKKNLSLIFGVLFLFLAGPVLGQDGSISGTVFDAGDTSAISGASVVLSRGLIQGQVLDTAQTDANGKFSFDSLDTGRRDRYTLVASFANFDTTWVTAIRLNNTPDDTVTIYLLAADTSQPPDTSAETGGFVGTVTDSATDSAIAGVKVVLSEGAGFRGAVLDSAVTDNSGKYSFSNIAISQRINYSISFSKSGYQPNSATRLILTTVGQIDTVDTKLAAMDISNSWVVYGKVTADSAGGTGVSGATVEISRQFGLEVRFSGTTNSDGNFSILVENTGMRYQVTAALAGYLGADTSLQVSSDSTEVNLVLVTDTSSNGIELSFPKNQSRLMVNVFPNPARGTLAFSFSNGNFGPISLRIFNLAGQEVKRISLNNSGKSRLRGVSVPHLPTGQYLWSAAQKGGRQIRGKILLVK